MIRQTKRLIAKSKTKQDVVKSRTISGTKLVGATAITLVALFAFGAADAAGTVAEEVTSTVVEVVDPGPSPEELAEIEKKKKINALYKRSYAYKLRAHRFGHKRGAGHRYHARLSPKTQSLAYEARRMNKWRRTALRERTLFIAKVRQIRIDKRKCRLAGFPRHLCPAIIRGATLEGKKRWAFDSNLAWIIRHESGFRPCVRNGGIIDCSYKGDRAYGLFQFLGSTWGGVGCRITPNVQQQTRCGIRYIARRYHTPAGAVSFWRANRWY